MDEGRDNVCQLKRRMRATKILQCNDKAGDKKITEQQNITGAPFLTEEIKGRESIKYQLILVRKPF